MSPFTLAASAEMLYLDLPFVDRVTRITDRGLQVEIWDWSTKDVDALAAVTARSRVVFSSMTGYLRGDLTTPDGIDALLATAAESLDRGGAARLPATQPARHRPRRPGTSAPARRDRHAHDVADRRRHAPPVAQLGEQAGRVFTLENLNLAVDHPGTPFARAADTLALVRAVDSPHLRMNLDLYHAQIGEGNLVELVREALPYIGEIQVADVPGRCEPGTGEIHYPAIVAALTRPRLHRRRRPRRLGEARPGPRARRLPCHVRRGTGGRSRQLSPVHPLRRNRSGPRRGSLTSVGSDL